MSERFVKNILQHTAFLEQVFFYRFNGTFREQFRQYWQQARSFSLIRRERIAPEGAVT